jgi:hypothetical protein
LKKKITVDDIYETFSKHGAVHRNNIQGWRITIYQDKKNGLEQCCPTFLCTRAQFSDAYGGAGATLLLLLPPPPPPLLLLLLLLLLPPPLNMYYSYYSYY